MSIQQRRFFLFFTSTHHTFRGEKEQLALVGEFGFASADEMQSTLRRRVLLSTLNGIRDFDRYGVRQ